jgi:hypothetical protein
MLEAGTKAYSYGGNNKEKKIFKKNGEKKSFFG